VKASKSNNILFGALHLKAQNDKTLFEIWLRLWKQKPLPSRRQ